MMKELSLNILDIAMNSVKAGATEIGIFLTEHGSRLTIEIRDNGCGMTPDFLAKVRDPFSTTRTTRAVGLGIPFFQMAAELTGGGLEIESRHKDMYPDSCGTRIAATFLTDSIDFTPLGDVISTVVTLIQGNPDIRWRYRHETDTGTAALDTAELTEVLGDVPLDVPEVLEWIRGYLTEQYDAL